MTKRVQKRAMTEAEIALARALSACSFTPATFDKRFAREMGAEAHANTPLISEKQAALLRDKVTRYRRQIDPASLPESERALLQHAKRAA